MHITHILHTNTLKVIYFKIIYLYMAKMKIIVDGYKCERCGHEWVKRKDKEPLVCPKCKSPYWNIPRKE